LRGIIVENLSESFYEQALLNSKKLVGVARRLLELENQSQQLMNEIYEFFADSLLYVKTLIKLD